MHLRGACPVRQERYGITSQMRRAASSIPANVVGRASKAFDKPLNSFSRLALRGALWRRLETFLILSTRLEMTKPENSDPLFERSCAEISKMLNALIKSTIHSPLTTKHYAHLTLQSVDVFNSIDTLPYPPEMMSPSWRPPRIKYP